MTIWLNVSTTATWSGMPFGIARVESSVARELLAWSEPSRIAFCVWDLRRRAFCELRRDQLSGLLHGTSSLTPLPLGVSRNDEPMKTQLSVKRLMGRAGGDLLLLRQDLISRRRSVVARIARSFARRITSEDRPAVHHTRPAGAGCLRPGDVLLTLGAEWEYGFMPLLAELKERVGIHVIGCCHDLIAIRYPQLCLPYVADQFPQYLKDLARCCDSVACISDASLRDLRSTLSDMAEPIPKLFRVQLGCALPADSTESLSETVSSLLDRAYLLFVSSIERRKNHEVLYRAFHRLTERYDQADMPLMVFVGSRGWGVDELLNDIARDPRTRDLIVLLHSASDRDLRALYEHALFCVFPSLHEGWGLPVAEALAFGKPVICSDRGPLREVGDDLVDYVDPWDVPGWVQAIERLWLDTGRRQRLSDNIVRRYRRPLWSETASTLAAAALELDGC
jgi:glycosyltransferase involved in cell wall biosynthesis